MATRVLVTGATGQLGAYLVRELASRELEVIAWGHSQPTAIAGTSAKSVDLTDSMGVASAFSEARPDLVIHAAAMADVGKCVEDAERAEAVNSTGTATLAGLSDGAGARLIFVSTDLVFDGEHAPYLETDPIAPLSVYGRTKAAGEQPVLTSSQNAVVRVSWMFGPSLIDRENFFDKLLAALRGGPHVRVFHDEWRTPLGLATAARALVGVALSEATGLLHVGGPESMSRLEIGQRLAAYLGTETVGLVSDSRSNVPGEPRPRDVSLVATRWRNSFPHEPWPTFEQALAEMDIG